MAEGTYEYEIMRAELLGVDPPDYDQFMKNKREQEAQKVEADEIDTEHLKEVDLQDGSLKQASGGLDELNSILSITQKKIDRFRVRCGSITNLLKLKMGGMGGDASNSAEKNGAGSEQEAASSETPKSEEAEDLAANSPPAVSQNGSGPSQKKGDLSKALDHHVDKLDAMLEKAENAHYSMAHQNKQMKKFLQ